MKPSMDYSRMTREEAVRHFGNRVLKLKTEIRALPISEKLRLAADFMDKGLGGYACEVAKLAVYELSIDGATE